VVGEQSKAARPCRRLAGGEHFIQGATEPTLSLVVSNVHGASSPGEAPGVDGMKWILVVLIGGVAPVQTDLQFDKLSDCLSAEEQLRTTYADAYEAWDRSAAVNIDRRRDYRRARDFQGRRLANTGTCIPHAGSDQPVAMTPRTGEPPTQTAPPPPLPR
jgi:hypothetical protein